MNTYIVTYDLKNPENNYETLIKKIRSYKSWARLGDSAYVISTKQSVVSIRNKLLDVLFNNDKLFVGKVNAPAAWYGLSEEVSDWLKNNLN